LLGAALLCCAVAGAPARQLQVVNYEFPFEMAWSSLEFVIGRVATVRCAVTLDGFLEGATFTKTGALQIGRVVAPSVGTCTGGSVTALTEGLPWAIDYSSFTGTLPVITGVGLTLIGLSASITPREQPECLLVTEARHPGRVTANVTREAGGSLTIPTSRMDETASIPLRGGFLEVCAMSEATLKGTGTEQTEAGTPVATIRLI